MFSKHQNSVTKHWLTLHEEEECEKDEEEAEVESLIDWG